jgi:hypothetical protein
MVSGMLVAAAPAAGHEVHKGRSYDQQRRNLAAVNPTKR